jgi:hypothetical protein
MTHQFKSSPVSFDAHVARLPRNGLPVVIEADAAQRAELARLCAAGQAGEAVRRRVERQLDLEDARYSDDP